MTADEARKIERVDAEDVATWLDRIMFEIGIKIEHEAMSRDNRVHFHVYPEFDALWCLFAPLDYVEHLGTIAKRLKALGFKIMIETSEDCMEFTEADSNRIYDDNEIKSLVIEW